MQDNEKMIMVANVLASQRNSALDNLVELSVSIELLRKENNELRARISELDKKPIEE